MLWEIWSSQSSWKNLKKLHIETEKKILNFYF
jgi:hypothetical protein